MRMEYSKGWLGTVDSTSGSVISASLLRIVEVIVALVFHFCCKRTLCCLTTVPERQIRNFIGATGWKRCCGLCVVVDVIVSWCHHYTLIVVSNIAATEALKSLR